MIIDVTSPPPPFSAMVPDSLSGGVPAANVAALNALISSSNEDSTFYFPKGRYYINGTIVFPHSTGYHVMGCGMSSIPNSTSDAGCESALVWAGTTTGQDMVRVQGKGLVWQNLSLWGKPPESTLTRAENGIVFLDTPSSSLPRPGNHWFSSIYIEDCDNAVVSRGGNGVGEVAFGYFGCKKCTNGLRLEEDNSNAWSFGFVDARDVDVTFLIEKGGGIRTRACSVTHDTSGSPTVVKIVSSKDNVGLIDISGLSFVGNPGSPRLFDDQNQPTATNKNHYVRFSNMTLEDLPSASVTVNRQGGTEGGQTILEFSGCRSLDKLNGQVVIFGHSATYRSQLIVNSSDVTQVASLISPVQSAYYKWASIDNWTFSGGIQNNSQGQV